MKLRMFTAMLAILTMAATHAPLAAEPVVAERLLAAINGEREAHGLARLVPDARLDRAAQTHADDMARRGYFAHESPEGSSMTDRLAKVGYAYATAAENLAAGQPDPQAVVASWMNSPGHRANMLLPQIREAGIGHVFLETDDRRFHHYWVLDVGVRMGESFGSRAGEPESGGTAPRRSGPRG